MLKRGEALTLQRWLNKLSPEIVQADPHLCLASAWTRLMTGPFEAIEPILQAAEAAINVLTDDAPAGHQALKSEIQAIRAIISIEQGDTSAATIESARQTLDELPGDDHFLNSSLATALAASPAYPPALVALVSSEWSS